MKRILLFSLLIAAVAFWGCENDETRLTRSNVNQDKKTPVIPQCDFGDDLTQEFLEAACGFAHGLVDTNDFDSLVFDVDINEDCFETKTLPSYSSKASVKAGVAIPAGTLPASIAGPDGLVRIHVKVIKLDVNFTPLDPADVRIYIESPINLQGQVDLAIPISIKLPMFPWYDDGDHLRFFDIDDCSDDPILYSNPQCQTINFGLTQMAVPWFRVFEYDPVFDGGGGGGIIWPDDPPGGGGE